MVCGFWWFFGLLGCGFQRVSMSVENFFRCESPSFLFVFRAQFMVLRGVSGLFTRVLWWVST